MYEHIFAPAPLLLRHCVPPPISRHVPSQLGYGDDASCVQTVAIGLKRLCRRTTRIGRAA